MVEVRLRMTEQMWDAILQTAYDASKAYGEDIPPNAVILAAAMKGLGAVRYEMTNETPKLRLAVNNDRTRDTGRNIQEIPQNNTGEG
jgi:hypothetical protein